MKEIDILESKTDSDPSYMFSGVTTPQPPRIYDPVLGYYYSIPDHCSQWVIEYRRLFTNVYAV